MAQAPTTTPLRERLHELVDALPDFELPSAVRYLDFLKQTSQKWVDFLEDPPMDDEPLTPEEEEAIREGEEDVAAGRTIPWEVARRELLKGDA